MKSHFRAIALLAATACLGHAQGLIMVKPMPPTEIVVELKSGLSSADVAQDVRQHRLTRLATAEELKAIQQAGASADLLGLAQSKALVAGVASAEKPAAKAVPEQAADFWIFGLLVAKTPDGGALVTCKDIHPDERLSTLSRAGDEYVHFTTIPPGAPTSDGRTLINCEAALIGKMPMRKHDGAVVEVPDMKLVKNLTAAPDKNANPVNASARPAMRRAVILQGGWNSLRAVGGPDVEMKLLGIDFDAIRVRFSTWPATRVVPVERGRDASTTIYDDGKGGVVAYIDSIDRPDNGGVFDFSTPANAKAPAPTAP